MSPHLHLQTRKSQLVSVLAEAFNESGFDPGNAERMAEFTLRLSQFLARAELEEICERLHSTVFGTALARVMKDTGESQRDAAKRLCVSLGAMQKAEKKIRECLGGSHLLIHFHR